MKKEKEAVKKVTGYDYSDREHRETTVAELFQKAKSARTAVETEWQKYNDYYNFIHDITGETGDFARETGAPFPAVVVPDAWIMVESQIDPNIPEPEFRGRDTDTDSSKAKKREFAVKYIIENNRLKDLNTRNERRMIKLGDAFWKAFWDVDMRCGMYEGDIRVADVSPENIFPDPSIRDGMLQDGQYLDYVYSMHKVAFCQKFRRDLDKAGIDPEDVMSEDYMTRSSVFDMTTAINDQDDTVQVLEHWFRQPYDTEINGESVRAGAVGCCIMAGGRELRYIPDYWKRTGRQCKLFPFVHTWRIGDETRFWNKSELFAVMDLIDAADRKLNMSLLNDAFMSNDIILQEEDSISDGCLIENAPGAIVTLKKNKTGTVQRLGGLHETANLPADMAWFKEQIERANRNYETSIGKEPERVTTATGLAMLRNDASEQEDIKKADRNNGFERLYELLDWLALEFYDDDRLLFLGADKDKNREAQSIKYNSDLLSQIMPEVTDLNGNVVREAWSYWPRVDVTITAGDSVIKGKQATLQALQALTVANITPDNWRLYKAQLDILDIPGKQEIIGEWEKRFPAPTEPGTEMPGMPGGMPEAGGGLPQLAGESIAIPGI